MFSKHFVVRDIEHMSVYWNAEKLYREIVCDRETCVKWCEENGLIPVRCTCHDGHEMNVKVTDNFVGYFICSRKHSSGKFVRFSRARGTVFENRRLPPEKFLCLVHCFVNDVSCRNGALECSIDGDSTSKSTVAECYNICRELLTRYLLEKATYFTSLGGINKRVEIIELALERPKLSLSPYNEGTVVIILIEQDSNNFIIQPFTRDEFSEHNLKKFIKDNLLKSTIVIPHSHRDFSSLSNEGFVILDTGTDKLRKFDKIARSSVDKLLEYLFKTHMKQNNIDVFEKMIEIIRHYYPL